MEQENFDQKIEKPQSSLKASPIAMTLIALGTVFILYQFFGASLTFLLFGGLNEANVQNFRLMTLISQFLFIFIPTLLFARWQEIGYKEIFKLKAPSSTINGSTITHLNFPALTSTVCSPRYLISSGYVLFL